MLTQKLKQEQVEHCKIILAAFQNCAQKQKQHYRTFDD